MSFGNNLQYLRKMRNKMTQEELAEKMGVSRQTISKWELDQGYPEIEKLLELCNFFSCTLDQLIREDMFACAEAYSDIRVERLQPFHFIPYTVISAEPEEDAIRHVRQWAETCSVEDANIIGWDFPMVSQEQIDVYGMHGYTAALVLEDESLPCKYPGERCFQEAQRYAAITIRHPLAAPFRLIPNAYKALQTYMMANGLRHPEEISVPCFEKEYIQEGVDYMDVYIAVE